MTSEIGSSDWRADQGMRQQLLNLCLSDLCEREISSLEELTTISRAFLSAYDDKQFRHRYADILTIIRDCDFPKGIGLEQRAQFISIRADGLAQNIKTIYTHRCDGKCIEAPDGCPVKRLQRDHRLWKLYDHVNLEARRASYEAQSTREMVAELQRASEEVQQTRAQLVSALNTLSGATKVTERAVAAGEKTMAAAKKAESVASLATEKANEASDKVKKQQIEMVSVLGVFSAIILAFNEGVVFSTSSISAVDRQSPYQIAFVVSIVGFILFNCLYGAFALVYRILRPNGKMDHLLRPMRIIGIELVAAACVGGLGIIAHPSPLELHSLHFVALVIAVAVFIAGLIVIALSGEKSETGT